MSKMSKMSKTKIKRVSSCLETQKEKSMKSGDLLLCLQFTTVENKKQLCYYKIKEKNYASFAI